MSFVLKMEVINMLQMELLNGGKIYKRVDKRVARKEYNAGRVVHLTTSKSYPGAWVGWHEIQLSPDPDRFDTFDNYVNEFAYYCCDCEMGKRVNYFIEK